MIDMSVTLLTDPVKQEAAEKALNALFQPPLRFKRDQITLDAAVFAFRSIVKVDQASRMSAGLFKLWSPTPIRSVAGIAMAFAKAVIAATRDPNAYKQSPIGSTIAVVHRRNLQYHLDDPETFPCPDYR
jgi:hypothetical protein